MKRLPTVIKTINKRFKDLAIERDRFLLRIDKQETEIEEMTQALAAIIGFTYKEEDETVDREWVHRTALKAFGCDTMEEYLEKIK